MKRIRREDGVTLVELLAALVLISLVVVLINSVFLFTQKNADTISKENDVQQEMLLAMKMMTRDIRSADKVEVENGKLRINSSETYQFETGNLKKNKIVIAEDLKSFVVCNPPLGESYKDSELSCNESKELDKNRIVIILEGPDNRAGNGRVLSTEIIMRGEEAQ